MSEGADLEAAYARGAEPWSYSERAVEILRHQYVVRRARALPHERMLDLGCSLGQLTELLAAIGGNLTAADVSVNATTRARDRVQRAGTCFVATSATMLGFRPCAFDLIVASDGLYSWNLSTPDRAASLDEIYAALEPGGSVIFTEHMRPGRFPQFIAEVAASRLEIVAVSYLYDRPCYQLESWFRAIHNWPIARFVRRNVAVARLLSATGSLFGPRASRHVCVVARRETK